MNEKSHDWFYMKKTIFSEDQEGPISEVELKKQIFAGIIKPETKLASPTRTKSQWKLLKSIPTLLTHYESGVTERRHQKLLEQQAKAAARLAAKELEQNSNLDNSPESVSNITSTPNLSPTHDHPQQSSQQIPSILERASQLNAFGRWDKFCTTCGCIGRPITRTKGSIIVELAMWILFCLPGVIYSVWRMTSRYKACPNCLSPNVIPIDSPIAKKMLRE